VWRNATPPSIAVDASDSRSTTAPTNHGLSDSQPLVYARRELLDHADRGARAQVRDDRLVGDEVLERQLHAVGDISEILIVADQLLLDPFVDRRALEAPLPIDLERRNLALHHELRDGRFVEV